MTIDPFLSPAEPLVLTAARLELIANRYFFAPLGMSFATVRIIHLLTKKGTLTPSELLQKIGGTKSNISQRLNLLEKEGFIRRTYASNDLDKRIVKVTLTPQGKVKMKAIEASSRKAKIELTKQFSPKELAEFKQFITKLNKILDQAEICLNDKLK